MKPLPPINSSTNDDRGEFVLVEFKLDDLDPNEFAFVLIIAGADDCLTPRPPDGPVIRITHLIF